MLSLLVSQPLILILTVFGLKHLRQKDGDYKSYFGINVSLCFFFFFHLLSLVCLFLLNKPVNPWYHPLLPLQSLPEALTRTDDAAGGADCALFHSHYHHLLGSAHIKTLNSASRLPPLWDMTAACTSPRLPLTLSVASHSLRLPVCCCYFVLTKHLTSSPLLSSSPSLSIRVINAGKSMLNEDQASCEKLFVKKPSGKQKNSTVVEDNGVRKDSRFIGKHLQEKMSAGLTPCTAAGIRQTQSLPTSLKSVQNITAVFFMYVCTDLHRHAHTHAPRICQPSSQCKWITSFPSPPPPLPRPPLLASVQEADVSLGFKC